MKEKMTKEQRAERNRAHAATSRLRYKKEVVVLKQRIEELEAEKRAVSLEALMLKIANLEAENNRLRALVSLPVEPLPADFDW